MPEYLAPGVYIEEMDLGPVPIQGVATSTGGIIGLCQRGPLTPPIAPTLITSLGQFNSTFGGALPPDAAPALPGNFNNVAYAVQGFFNNGGTVLYVIRVAPTTATYWSEYYELQNAGGAQLILQASDPGSWANPQFGVLYGRYQQTDGLSITFSPESNMPYSVQAGSTLTTINLSSTAGLYLGAVVAWSTAPGVYEYGVISGLSDNSITLYLPLAEAPSSPSTLVLVEFTIAVNFLAGGQVVQSETWHNCNLNAGVTTPQSPNYVVTVLGASSLISASLSSAIDLTQTAAYALAPGSPAQVPPSQSGIATTSTTITGLTDTTTYAFSVAGVNAAGAGPEAAEVEAVPTAAQTPTGLTATAGDGQVSLTWSASAGATGYTVYYSASSGEETTNTLGFVSTSDTSCIATENLTNGTEYYFVVEASNAGGASGPSSEVSATPTAATTAPATPTGLTAAAGDAQVTLNWDAAANAAYYQIYVGTSPNGESSTAATPPGPVYGSTSATVNVGLTNGTEYYFQVKAFNSFLPAGTGPSNEASATPQAPPPPAIPATPTGVVATSGDQQITLTWSASPGATGYSVYYSTTSGAEMGASGSSVSTSGTLCLVPTSPTLENGTTYYFEVVANNASGNSAPSTEVSSVPGTVTIPPAAPTGLTATPANDQVTLAWSPSPGASSYDVYISTPGDDGLSTITTAAYNALFNDPSLDTDDPSTRGGIYAFQNIRGMMMISMPGNTDPGVQADLLALCQNDGYKFAMLDPAPATDVGVWTDWHYMDASTTDIITQRGNYDSEYGALYYPWINIEDPDPPNPNNVGTVNISPSGYQMGITARVDINRGVYKAPANEIVQGAVSFSHPIDQGTQDVLNPLGINCYRDFRAENYGLRIWGARTVSSNSLWKYVNIRRLFQYVEASIQYGTEWVVFEPNNSVTWARVRQSVTDFLTDTWRAGWLMGGKPAEAFYVTCDYPDTMSMAQIQNGQLICEIGIAPVFPAEFVIFQISQWTGSAQGS
jgi:phage tail sheath protein FI/fibronectin type 3 domain-containing protein